MTASGLNGKNRIGSVHVPGASILTVKSVREKQIVRHGARRSCRPVPHILNLPYEATRGTLTVSAMACFSHNCGYGILRFEQFPRGHVRFL